MSGTKKSAYINEVRKLFYSKFPEGKYGILGNMAYTKGTFVIRKEKDGKLTPLQKFSKNWDAIQAIKQFDYHPEKNLKSKGLVPMFDSYVDMRGNREIDDYKLTRKARDYLSDASQILELKYGNTQNIKNIKNWIKLLNYELSGNKKRCK